MNVEESIRSHILSELSFPGSPEELTDDYPLLERGVVDSLGILKLVLFLEEDLDVEIEDEDLIPDHFESIAAIAQLVAAKASG